MDNLHQNTSVIPDCGYEREMTNSGKLKYPSSKTTGVIALYNTGINGFQIQTAYGITSIRAPVVQN